jgi:hypothetical protein
MRCKRSIGDLVVLRPNPPGKRRYGKEIVKFGVALNEIEWLLAEPRGNKTGGVGAVEVNGTTSAFGRQRRTMVGQTPYLLGAYTVISM